MDGSHVRQPKGRRGEPLVIQGGSSPETREKLAPWVSLGAGMGGSPMDYCSLI